MSTEHHPDDDHRSGPNETGEQVEDPGIQVVSADEMEPASSTHDQRWHDVLANFVDDPRGSVLAATDLVVNDVSAFIAALDQRRQIMLDAPSEDHAATEDLRKAAATYRDISKQLTASTQALKASHRGKLARDDREAERREVRRFDAAGGRQGTQHRDSPPAQRQPRESSSQDQRR